MPHSVSPSATVCCRAAERDPLAAAAGRVDAVPLERVADDPAVPVERVATDPVPVVRVSPDERVAEVDGRDAADPLAAAAVRVSLVAEDDEARGMRSVRPG